MILLSLDIVILTKTQSRQNNAGCIFPVIPREVHNLVILLGSGTGIERGLGPSHLKVPKCL
jgi:hypothetical protein